MRTHAFEMTLPQFYRKRNPLVTSGDIDYVSIKEDAVHNFDNTAEKITLANLKEIFNKHKTF